MRFYPGLSYTEALSLPAYKFNSLWQAIDVIESQEHLAHIRAVTYPKLTKAARRERDKKLYAAAYPKHIYKKSTQDVNFLLEKLGGTDGRRK